MVSSDMRNKSIKYKSHLEIWRPWLVDQAHPDPDNLQIAAVNEGGWKIDVQNCNLLLFHQFCVNNNIIQNRENCNLLNQLPIKNCTANVLPMETTDFVCVQNPALVYLCFFKRIYCRFHLEKFRIFRVTFS